MCQVTMKAPRRLIKAGALHRRHAARVTSISAWAEVVGYVCSVVSKSLQLQDLLERERLLSQELAQHCVCPVLCPVLWTFPLETALQPCCLDGAGAGVCRGACLAWRCVLSPTAPMHRPAAQICPAESELPSWCSANVHMSEMVSSSRRPPVHAICLTWAGCAEL